MRITLLIAAIFFIGCTSLKEIPPLEGIEPKLDVAAQWVAPTGEKHLRQFHQLPVAVEGDKVYLANTEGYVASLHLISGKLLWQTQLNERLIGGPGYGDGALYVITNEALLIALEEGTGKELWRQQLSSEVLASPLVAGNKIYVQTIDGNIYALDRKSGKTIWSDGREIPALTLRGTANPLLIGESLIVGYATGQIVAYNAATGEKIWEAPVAVPRGRTELERIVDIDGLFNVKDDTLYATAYQGRIVALSVQNGRVKWSRDMSSYTGIAVGEQHIFVSDAQGYVWALDINTGATMWRQDKLIDREITAPAILGDTVVVADIGGEVHWLSKDDGDFLARVNMYELYLDAFVDWGDEDLSKRDYGVTTAIKAVDDHVLVRNNEGSLAVFTLKTGE